MEMRFFLIWERTPPDNFETPHYVGFPSRDESLCQEKATDRNMGPHAYVGENHCYRLVSIHRLYFFFPLA